MLLLSCSHYSWILQLCCCLKQDRRQLWPGWLVNKPNASLSIRSHGIDHIYPSYKQIGSLAACRVTNTFLYSTNYHSNAREGRRKWATSMWTGWVEFIPGDRIDRSGMQREFRVEAANRILSHCERPCSHSYSSNCQLGVTCSLNHVLRAGVQVKGSLGQLELRDEGSPVGGVEGYLGSSLISCMYAALPLCVSELISQTLSQFWQASIINLAIMCLLQDDCSLRHSVQANKR